ncbi:MAG: C39 family peptidase [Candidatus Moranbacteria bacterium]|nr:C39 family peptidase [Candidatus Moranbacteria bacterium]MDD3964763.1 C39 family peptidase [Candidatus Moranbacteria bacterium]
MKQKFLFILLMFCTLGMAIGFFVVSVVRQSNVTSVQDIPQGEKVEEEKNRPIVTSDEKKESDENRSVEREPKKVRESSFLENVPFTTQAPFGEWDDPVFQNGCEEAALVMAEYWLTGKPLTKEIAKKEIIALSKFQKKTIGQSIDTSTEDTEKLLREYYSVTTSTVQTNITLLDIREALSSGVLVIVPADGRKLHNPNYTQPGPTTHMLVIIGYDAEKQEFITNDSGTRNGKGYRYREDVLFEAIRDYPTGNHLPIPKIEKSMIIVRKE